MFCPRPVFDQTVSCPTANQIMGIGLICFKFLKYFIKKKARWQNTCGQSALISVLNFTETVLCPVGVAVEKLKIIYPSRWAN